MSPRSRSLLFFIATLLLAAVFVRLGLWQVSRLRERRGKNAVALAARQAPTLVYDDPGQVAKIPDVAMDNRRVRVIGRFDHAADIVLRGQSEGGVPGVRIITPLRPLRGDSAILVQRGFVVAPDARSVNLAVLQEEGIHTITGIAFVQPASGVDGAPLEEQGQLTWRRVDLAALRARLPYPLHSWVLLQLPDSSLPALPRRDDPPVLDDGPHFSYAVQWLSFAITAVVVGVVVGFRRK